MAAHRPFLGGLAAGAGTAFAALLFGTMSASSAVFAITLVAVAGAAIVAPPFVFARVAGTVAGLLASLALAGAIHPSPQEVIMRKRLACLVLAGAAAASFAPAATAAACATLEECVESVTGPIHYTGDCVWLDTFPICKPA